MPALYIILTKINKANIELSRPVKNMQPSAQVLNKGSRKEPRHDFLSGLSKCDGNSARRNPDSSRSA
jgi:hypothetical protein